MPPIDNFHALMAFGVAAVAGAINSVAGGGTLMVFPALLALGLNPIAANATATLALWPGAFGSIVGYRKEFGGIKKRFFWPVVPALIGGGVGAWLLYSTPVESFEAMAPWLLLFASTLFSLHNRLKWHLSHKAVTPKTHAFWIIIACTLQLLVSVYGGYFGAGMSIMTLALFGLLGLADIVQMNAMTVTISAVTNGVAAILFIAHGMVDWRWALIMGSGSALGGFFAAGVARKIDGTLLRRFAVGVGYTLGVALLARVWWK